MSACLSWPLPARLPGKLVYPNPVTPPGCSPWDQKAVQLLTPLGASSVRNISKYAGGYIVGHVSYKFMVLYF